MTLSRRALLTGAALTATLLAGCGGEASPSPQNASGGASGSRVKITVAVVPVADVMPIYLGVKAGIFAKNGLDVQVVQAGGAAAAIPLLLNGEANFAYGAFQPIITAASQDVPITIVSGGISRAKTPDQDIAAIVVKPDSPLSSLNDLPGHTVAINALRAGPEAAVRIAMANANAKADTVKFVEVPLPETIDTVKKGRVDAAYVPEPFRTQAIANGLKVIAAPVYQAVPEGSTSAYFSSQSYAAQNPAVVAAFRKAVSESSAYATQHDKQVRDELVNIAKISPEVAAKINLPNFDPQLNRAALQDAIAKLKALGWIENEPSLDTLVTP